MQVFLTTAVDYVSLSLAVKKISESFCLKNFE